MPSLALKTIDKIWRFFVSLRLTFVLLGFIGIGAVIGMSFDQTLTFEDFLRKREDEKLLSVLNFFELYDTFHSWWFSFAILLLALNLIACSIERLPRIYFDYMRPRPYLTDRRLLGLPLNHTFAHLTLERAQKMVETLLGVKLSRARLPRENYFYYEKHAPGRFGVYVVHIALLIIMFSSIYTTNNGVDGLVLIEEGQKARFITARGPGGVSYTHDLGFYVGCDDFRLRTFVDNSPMEFESDLYISQNGKDKVAAKTVRVNEPLSYAGYTFYQSSFQPVISERVVEIVISDGKDYQKHHRVRIGSPVSLPNGDIYTVEKIYEDFGGLGQALRIAKKSEKASTYFHVFRRYAEYDQQVRGDSYFVKMLESDQRYATGLSIGKVPGISVIFAGFLLFSVGLILCFFLTPVRYFARIINDNGSYRVVFAAQGFRNPQSVKTDFMQRLERVTEFRG